MPLTRFRTILIALVGAALLVGPGIDPAAATDVHGDDERDVYVGTGGLLLPGSVDIGTRREVAGCSGCTWRLTSPCVESAWGVPFDGQSPCSSVVRGCPGGRLLRSWFREDGPLRQTGLVCLTDREPVTVTRVAGEVAERIEQGIPPMALRFQPTAGILTQVPLLLSTGQPRDQRWRMPLLGREVSVDAQASWSWEFGDGGHLDTTNPGGAYPHAGVSHVYRSAGGYRVACTTRWSASFTVDGLGPFEVPQAITQHAERVVDVGEGRALLTPGGMAQ